MNAINFIKQHGVDKAREVVEGAPDKTATHYVFRKISNYYSVEFQSWFHDGEWWDSDCHTEQDLIDSYGLDFVVSLSDLKRLVESIYLVKEHCTLERAEKYADSPYTAPEIKVCLLDAIADYKSAYSNDMGDDTHIENDVSPLCKVEAIGMSDFEKYWEENASKDSWANKAVAWNIWKEKQSKIDELQKRIDAALEIISCLTDEYTKSELRKALRGQK